MLLKYYNKKTFYYVLWVCDDVCDDYFTTLQLIQCGTNMILAVHLSNNAFQYFFQKPH